jgi:hypothetical protein
VGLPVDGKSIALNVNERLSPAFSVTVSVLRTFPGAFKKERVTLQVGATIGAGMGGFSTFHLTESALLSPIEPEV